MYCIATIIGGDVSGLSEERVMRKFLFVLASTAPLAMMHPAPAQMYLPPSPGGGTFTSDYVPPPSYVAPAPGYGAPGYVAPAPGYVAPGYTNPGYTWREQRANEDWRNNTWREQRYNENWRNNNWRTERANEDWRQREDYAKQSTPNNAVDRGYIGNATATDNEKIDRADKNKACAPGSVEASRSCLDYSKDQTKIDRSADRMKSNALDPTAYPSHPTYPGHPAYPAYPPNGGPVGGR